MHGYGNLYFNLKVHSFILMEILLTKDHGIKINFKDMEFYTMKFLLNLMIHLIIKILIILKSKNFIINFLVIG